MNESNLWSLSATELRHAYMKRTLSPVEVLESYLGRITTLNPKVNALSFDGRGGVVKRKKK